MTSRSVWQSPAALIRTSTSLPPSPPLTTGSTVSFAPTPCSTAARYSMVVGVIGCPSFSRRPVQRRGAAWRRRIVPDLEGAVDRRDLAAPAPARDKGAGERRVAKMDRDRVIEHTAQPGGGHRPALGAAIIVEPRLQRVEPAAEPLRRHPDADPHRKPPLGLADHQSGAGRHANYPLCSRGPPMSADATATCIRNSPPPDPSGRDQVNFPFRLSRCALFRPGIGLEYMFSKCSRQGAAPRRCPGPR